MKIKDLPPHKSLRGVRFVYPGDGKSYYWRSQWNKGVWGSETMESTEVIPLLLDSLEDALEWEVAE